MKKKLLVYGGLTLAILIYGFFAAPNLNPLYADGAMFWTVVATLYLAVYQLMDMKGFSLQMENGPGGRPGLQFHRGEGGKLKKWVLIVLAVIWGIYLIAVAGSSVLFGSRAYRDQMSVPVEKSFDADVQAIDVNQIPIVDKDLAYKLAGKQLGTESSLGSQVVLGEPTMQQVNGKLIWAVPLHHSGFFKWVANNDGAQGYIVVSATNMNDVQYVRDYKIKIQPNSYFMDDLERHVRFGAGLFTGITDYSFELDESGRPYWVVTTYENKWGFNLPEANGIILVDATTGQMNRYDMDNIPAWVDRVQPEDFIINQLNNHGQYIHGIFNFSNFEKQRTSEGHIIVYNNNRCYLFTGITSVGSDESAIKFVMVDMITKESVEYKINGATENAAMSSAQGKVQDLGYTATFPLILNVNTQPTYFMALKDAEGLIKKYSFVSVKNYGIVGVGDSVNEALDSYERALKQSDADANIGSGETGKTLSLEGTVLRIAQEVSGDGGTTYSMLIKEKPNLIFRAPSELSAELVLTQPGDRVSMEFPDTKDSTVVLSSFDNLEISQLPATETSSSVSSSDNRNVSSDRPASSQ